jgi:hypothetical protein
MILRRKKYMLPQMTSSNIFISNTNKKLLILAEGFESRTLSWINHKENKELFDKAIICKYLYHTATKYDDVLLATKRHCKGEPETLDYDRFEPTIFETHLLEKINECNRYDEVVIDISVMSKLLLLIIIYSLVNFNGRVRIIYSEPEIWGPQKDKYENALKKKKETDSWISLSSVGISSVIRTPNLSSIIMQNCPTFLISFLSFNEQLFGALVNEITPSKLQIINHSCKRQNWREDAMRNIHADVIHEYFGNDIEPIFTADVLDYIAVFEKLASIYCYYCYDYRIVVSPTGGKIHAVAVALLKLCCPDVHIEYPTPESYLFDDYTSSETHEIHQIVFEKFNSFIANLSNDYKLNG